MAAGLAHEIRNPLGSMSSALQFLQEKNTNRADDSALIDVVLKESDRLNQIISNFLAYSRPNYDSLFRENCDLLDVGETIEDCLLLLRHNPDISENHQFDFQIPKTPVRIKANETQIKQVFWNLTKNSLKAMPDGGKFSVKLQEISDKNVQIIFEDTGRGINPDYLEQLFEPFSSKANGTGLGLSIVHKIVNDHNGRIDVQSKLGKGTKITIELPQAV
jgi:signal transduction histidine kinase